MPRCYTGYKDKYWMKNTSLRLIVLKNCLSKSARFAKSTFKIFQLIKKHEMKKVPHWHSTIRSKINLNKDFKPTVAASLVPFKKLNWKKNLNFEWVKFFFLFSKISLSAEWQTFNNEVLLKRNSVNRKRGISESCYLRGFFRYSRIVFDNVLYYQSHVGHVAWYAMQQTPL